MHSPGHARQVATAMQALMEHLAWCEERGGRARPGDSAARQRAQMLGLIETATPHPGATNRRPFWVRTEAGRAWKP